MSNTQSFSNTPLSRARYLLVVLACLIIIFILFGIFKSSSNNKDSTRIKDIAFIAAQIEDFYKMQGHYPLLSEPQAEKIYVAIVKDKTIQHKEGFLSYTLLKEALQKGLHKPVILPMDPQGRPYVYATNGQDFWVSALLNLPKEPLTYKSGNLYKIDLASTPAPWINQYRLKDALWILKYGPEDRALQKDLSQALYARDFAKAEGYLNAGANPGFLCYEVKHTCQPLAGAAKEGALDVLYFLIEKGADLDGRNAYGDVALIKALEAKQFEAAKILVKAGANVNIPNAFGITPFISASMNNDLELVQLMLDRGGNVNNHYLVQYGSLEQGTTNVRPLFAAVREGHIEIVKLLLSAGADPYLTSRGRTVLEMAIEKGNKDIIELIKSVSPDYQMLTEKKPPTEYSKIIKTSKELLSSIKSHKEIETKTLANYNQLKSILEKRRCKEFKYKAYKILIGNSESLYFIASKGRDIIIGRHFKVPLYNGSPDLSKLESSTIGCLNLGGPPPNISSMYTSNLEPYPNEFHLLQSHLHDITIYVTTEIGVYKVSESSIELLQK